MNKQDRCPACGAEIPDNAPAGQCPKCLLEIGLGSADRSPSKTEATPNGPSTPTFEPPPIDDLTQSFPQLEILELLGQGGMGAVYKARQKNLDRFVAVKILPPEVGADPAFADRFVREARALARLSHPNIVAVHDAGSTDNLYYLIMEYVEGLNLRQAMQTGRVGPEQALSIVPQVCDALQFAHDQGIVHRDIKPENILVDKQGRVRIADFGLAKLLGHAAGDVSLTGTQQVMGTLRYMAPEQMESSKVADHRADIYSLGVVFYELLTGELPMGRFAPPSQKVKIDVRVDEVVLRALEKEPERRYQCVGEVRTDVLAIAAGPTSAVPPSVAASAGREAIKATSEAGGVASSLRDGKSVREVLVGLRWLLICVNLAVLVLGIVLGVSREYSFSAQGYLEYAAKLVMHKYPAAAVMVFASGVLSVGIYLFAASLVRAKYGRLQEDFPNTGPIHEAKAPVGAPGQTSGSQGPVVDLSSGQAYRCEDGRAGQALLAMGALTVTSGVFTFLLLTGGLVDTYSFDSFFRQDAVLIPLLVLQTLTIPVGILMVIGGISTRHPGSPWSRLGMLLGLIPLTPASLITLPLSLWGLSVLRRRELPATFEAAAKDVEGATVSAVRKENAFRAPAIGQFIAAVLQVLLCLAIAPVAAYVMSKTPGRATFSDTVTMNLPVYAAIGAWLLACFASTGVMIIGSVTMLRRHAEGWSTAGAVAGMIPLTPAWLLSAPCGIWALIVLRRAMDVQ